MLGNKHRCLLCRLDVSIILRGLITLGRKMVLRRKSRSSVTHHLMRLRLSLGLPSLRWTFDPVYRSAAVGTLIAGIASTMWLAILCWALLSLIHTNAQHSVRPFDRGRMADNVVAVTEINATAIMPRDARVAIVEFADFECPFCGAYARGTFRTIRERYVETNKVAYVFRQYPLARIHPSSASLSRIAVCAGDRGRYWDIHAFLFEHQFRVDRMLLQGFAESIGLDPAVLEKCSRSVAAAASVKADQAEGQRLGVVATPTFLLGRPRADRKTIDIVERFSGAPSIELLGNALDKLIDESPR